MIKIELFEEKNGLYDVIKTYSFYNIQDHNLDIISNQQITQNLKQSKAFIISIATSNDLKFTFFILSFYKTLIIIKSTLLSHIQSIFLKNNSDNNELLEIYFLNNSKEIFNEQITIQNLQHNCDSFFLEEISNLNKKINNLIIQSGHFNLKKEIVSCISGYLIRESYFKLKEEQKLNFNKTRAKINEFDLEKFNENDFIELRILGSGVSQVSLYYQIDKGELFAVKKNVSNLKLFRREFKNYLEINFPLIPKIYGKISESNYLVIQFIDGSTLNEKKYELNFDDIIVIIFELMLIINYFHENGFIYRDLKPNNVIIDETKTAFIIDFDRMIKLSDLQYNNENDSNKTSNYENHTTYFQSGFVSPEVLQGKSSQKSDIYSIGKIIHYLIEGKNENMNTLMPFYIRCIDENEESRPSILELIFEFYKMFFSYINKSNVCNFNEVDYLNGIVNYKKEYVMRDVQKAFSCYSILANRNDPEAQFYLGLINYTFYQDINKTMYYYLLALNQNNVRAQYNLGVIYLEGKYVTQNINKAIHYFSLASNQNDVKAQFNLGYIYFEGKYVERDINKAIHYFSLASDQNDHNAQFLLGIIFYKNEYCVQNINKSFDYIKLSASQKNSNALFCLGIIYYEGKYTKQNIPKSVHYLVLAANQNHLLANFYLQDIKHEKLNLDLNNIIPYLLTVLNKSNSMSYFLIGLSYYHGDCRTQDINKAIHYFSLASSQNDKEAQFELGLIYYEGKYVKRDINKAIHYFSLASNQNHIGAQYILGLIYYEGKYVERDISKAINFYSLASNQDHQIAQLNLGYIYYEGNYVARDINKAIHFFSLASNQNNEEAQFNLGYIYYEGKCAERNVNKAIHYYSLASNQSNTEAQFNLGYIYFEGKYVEKDINKAIHYFSLSERYGNRKAQYLLGIIYMEGKYIEKNIDKAIYCLKKSANQNYADVQFELGIIYSIGQYVKKDMIKGLNYFIQASDNDDINAHFIVGYFYHEGIYVNRDIDIAVRHYKEASSFNMPYAKNNLGVIYKNGFGDKIRKSISTAIIYFEEAIRINKAVLSIFNLSHIYIYENGIEKGIEKAINLLIDYSDQPFEPSNELLCIALIKKHGYDIQKIRNELLDKAKKSSKFPQIIIQKIVNYKFDIEKMYKKYENVEFLYDFLLYLIQTKEIDEKKSMMQKNDKKKNITSQFYEGFGFDIKS